MALDAGYGSHEAFTRAFRDQFGLTPEQVRGRGTLSENLKLVEAIPWTINLLPTSRRPGHRTPRLPCASPASPNGTT